MTPPKNWQADLVRARTGDRDALGRLLDAVRNYLRQIARQELWEDLRSKEDASDMVQETFAKASQGFDGFRGASPNEWEAWLRSILLHILQSSRREYCTLKRAVGREQPIAASAAPNPLANQLVAVETEPVEAVIAQERDAALALAVVRLREHHREILLMRCTEELSFAEIGRRLGVGENAAQKRWKRAVERLQEALGESF